MADKGVHREDDFTTGHTCPDGGPCGYAPPTEPATYSEDVFCNDLAVVRRTDCIVPHQCLFCAPCVDVPCCVPCSPHDGQYMGTSTVFVNDLDMQYEYSPIDCTNGTGCGTNGSPDGCAYSCSDDVFGDLTNIEECKYA